MAGRNDFHPFAVATDAIVLSNEQWATELPRKPGHKPGIASSALANKAERQGTVMAAAWGLLVAECNRDALDNGDIPGLANALRFMISQIGGHDSTAKASTLTNVMLTLTVQNVENGYCDLPENVSESKIGCTAVFLNTNVYYYGRDYTVVLDENGNLRRINFTDLGLEGVPVQAGDLAWVFYHTADGTTPLPPLPPSGGNLWGGDPQMQVFQYPDGNLYGGTPGMVIEDYVDGNLYGGTPESL